MMLGFIRGVAASCRQIALSVLSCPVLSCPVLSCLYRTFYSIDCILLCRSIGLPVQFRELAILSKTLYKVFNIIRDDGAPWGSFSERCSGN